jgi:hypothetical protein
MLSIYVVLVIIALILFPEPFSPLSKTLAQLGNPAANPSGALFYNIGTIFTSVPIVLIVGLSLTLWRPTMSKTFQKGKAYFYLTAIFFMSAAVFNVLTAIVPLGTNNDFNSLFSLCSFISFQLFAAISALGIRGNADHTRLVPELGFATVCVNILLFSLLAAGLIIASLVMTVLFWTYIVAFLVETS